MNWEYYLTGLIEADGSIYVPKKKKCIQSLKNLYPCIQISFHAKDFPLITMIQRKLQGGSISRIKGKRAYVLSISSNDLVFYLMFVLNGKMRTNKINQLYKLIDWYNRENPLKLEKELVFNGREKNKNDLGLGQINTVEKKGIDKSSFLENAWLSGFIDGDGCFYLRCTEPKENNKYTSKFECKFEISQSSQNLLSDLSSLQSRPNIIESISLFLGSNPKQVKQKTKFPQWRSRTVNVEQNRFLVEYLTKYPLQSSKYLDFMDWSKAVDIFLKKEHKTLQGKNNILSLKKNMNDSRKFYSWDHIIYF